MKDDPEYAEPADGPLRSQRTDVTAAALAFLFPAFGLGCAPSSLQGGPDGAPPNASDGAVAAPDGAMTAAGEGVATAVDGATANANDTDAVVAQCETLAKSFADNCNNLYSADARAPDTQRACIWTTYQHICRTGNTQLLVDSMNCLGGNPSCWTFSDPNTAAGCLATVHARGESAAASALLQNVCADCGGETCTGGAPNGTAELLPYVSDGEMAAISACLGRACTSPALLSNCASVPDVSGIFGCK